MRTLQELEALYAENDLSAYFEAMKPYAKNAIRFSLTPCSDEDIPMGSSRLGGMPDLPAGMDWPCRDCVLESVPMSFIGQINFAEVKPFDVDGKLPERGILYFFYDCNLDDGMPWGFDPKDGDGKKVFFYDGDLSLLERRETPEPLLEDNLSFSPARLHFTAGAELPHTYSAFGEMVRLSDDEDDRLYDLLEELEEEDDCPCINKILGHSDNVQGSMEDECEMVTQGYYAGNPEGTREARAKGIDKNFAHWTLLMQVDSNEELGMMWGDCGRLYLWITEEDLAAGNFDRTWLILQCG